MLFTLPLLKGRLNRTVSVEYGYWKQKLLLTTSFSYFVLVTKDSLLFRLPFTGLSFLRQNVKIRRSYGSYHKVCIIRKLFTETQLLTHTIFLFHHFVIPSFLHSFTNYALILKRRVQRSVDFNLLQLLWTTLFLYIYINICVCNI